MTGRRPEVWLADLVQALDAVGDGPGTRDRVARLLGFGHVPAGDAPRDAGLALPAATPPGPDAPPEFPADTVPAEEPSAAPDTEPPGGPTRLGDLPLLLPVRTDAPATTDWASVPSLPQVTDEHIEARPPLEPLFAQRSSAALLTSALTTTVPDGEPDIDALVEGFARGVPLTRLPRAPRPTLRFGVQLLVDLGESMQPYLRDQRELVRQITALVGAELTHLCYFADLPTRGAGPGGRRTWRPYRTPGAGTRVLIVSDLGVGGPVLNPRRASVAEWHHLLDDISRAGCSTLALVPYPVAWVPAGFAGLLSALTWDRTTTVSTVAALGERRR